MSPKNKINPDQEILFHEQTGGYVPNLPNDSEPITTFEPPEDVPFETIPEHMAHLAYAYQALTDLSVRNTKLGFNWKVKNDGKFRADLEIKQSVSPKTDYRGRRMSVSSQGARAGENADKFNRLAKIHFLKAMGYLALKADHQVVQKTLRDDEAKSAFEAFEDKFGEPVCAPQRRRERRKIIEAYKRYGKLFQARDLDEDQVKAEFRAIINREFDPSSQPFIIKKA
jgi:hypothetical protein